MSTERSLFEVDLPDGFRYRPDFITPDEEASLADAIARVEFETFEMRGVAARRRVAFFGMTYEDRAPSAPLPEFLMPFRDKTAAAVGLDPRGFAMALINEYRPGTPIGWHRDAPQYGIVAGISLLSSCRMKFRPYVRPSALATIKGQRRTATHEIVLEPRSMYLMAGASRNSYEHHIPAVDAMRYSITFRTVRSR